VIRRIHVNVLQAGEISLQADQAHHLRDVLRVGEGAEIEVFDDHGTTGRGIVLRSAPGELIVQVDAVHAPASAIRWTIASAIPKAARADWMIEKLSELGTTEFIPLATARSVVHPKGENKRDRWTRIAAESAKQSRRAGVMTIHPLMSLDEVIARVSSTASVAGYLSTAPNAQPLIASLHNWQLTTDNGQLTTDN
jgi:16S rRNA (uracil1498-N3)-methyltransferase